MPAANRSLSLPSLRRCEHRVTGAGFGSKTAFKNGTLTVNREEAVRFFADRSLADISLSFVSPGQSARIIKVLDCVEPRAKKGSPDIFPGFVGPRRYVGGGETHVLRGAQVLVAGYLPRAQESLIDMMGPGAQRSPFSRQHTLIVEFSPVGDPDWVAVEKALRSGLLRLAAYLAQAALDAPCDESIVLAPCGGKDPNHPIVGTITNLQTQGAFKDVFFFGRSLAGAPPTYIEANLLEDGAVVSGQYGHPGLKNPTYLHQNNPVVAALRARDDLSFGGVILSPEPVEQAEKELTSALAARLCAGLGWDGVVVTKEGGGNADSDMALKMDALEELGIESVGIFAEMAGPDGKGPSLVSPPARATGMVSSGNYDERIHLPAAEQAFGGDELALLGAPATQPLELPTAVLYGSLNPLGAGQLTCAS